MRDGTRATQFHRIPGSACAAVNLSAISHTPRPAAEADVAPLPVLDRSEKQFSCVQARIHIVDNLHVLILG